MKNKYLFLCITFKLMMSVCKGQEISVPVFKSKTFVPRIFKSEDYKYFELSGKVKTTQWIVEEYTITGNTNRWYFTDGYVDKINLQFNHGGAIISGNYVRYSKKKRA